MAYTKNCDYIGILAEDDEVRAHLDKDSIFINSS